MHTTRAWRSTLGAYDESRVIARLQNIDLVAAVEVSCVAVKSMSTAFIKV
jgi:hypothetical protein